MKSLVLSILGSSYTSLSDSGFFQEYAKDITPAEYGTELYFSNKDKGIEFIFDRNRVLTCIHLFGKGHKEFNTFEGEIPLDISFDDDKLAVYDECGEFTVKEGGGEILPILGKRNEWSIFEINNQNFRFEFDKDRIVLLTVTKIE